MVTGEPRMANVKKVKSAPQIAHEIAEAEFVEIAGELKTLNIADAYAAADHPSDKWLPYLGLYQKYLGGYVSRPEGLLVEVGVQAGGSLDMWAKFLPKGWTIIGIDIDPACAELKYDSPNVSVAIGNQADPEFWKTFLEGKVIDIFIDDGSHMCDHQIETIKAVWQNLNDFGGTYIVEDIHTSYMPYNGGGLNRRTSFVEYAKGLFDVLHFSWKDHTTSDLEMKWRSVQGLQSVHMYDSMVVLEKGPAPTMERVTNKPDVHLIPRDA